MVLDNVTRREYLSGIGLGCIVGLSGCLNAPTNQGSEANYYVGLFHWGFALFNDQGEEIKTIQAKSGSRITLLAFDFGAATAIQTIPPEVRTQFPEHEVIEERSDEAIPAPSGSTLEARREEDEKKYPDHGLVVISSDRRQRLTQPVDIPHDATELIEVTFSTGEPGSFAFVCTVNCGYGHQYMIRERAVVVS